MGTSFFVSSIGIPSNTTFSRASKNSVPDGFLVPRIRLARPLIENTVLDTLLEIQKNTVWDGVLEMARLLQRGAGEVHAELNAPDRDGLKA
jgi:hypothetical protein